MNSLPKFWRDDRRVLAGVDFLLVCDVAPIRITIRLDRCGRFWREGERTEFEVLNGNAKLVERCEVGAKAAQLRDRTEPI